MCRSTPPLAGLRKTVPVHTGGQERWSTTTWLTRPISRTPICTCIASIGRHGRLKWCSGRGSKDGEQHHGGTLNRGQSLPVRHGGLPPRKGYTPRVTPWSGFDGEIS